MIKLDILKGKNCGVVGLGKSGLATLNSLKTSNIKYIWFDDSETAKTSDNIKEFRPINHPDWKEIDIIIASPGIDISKHAINKVKFDKSPHIICDIELLYLAKKNSIFIAITGTNGKSTTTSLINHILLYAGFKSEAGGNIGLAALSMSEETEYYVLELSSYQLELIKETKFNYAILLNITPDHLERHSNMENYINAKKNIFLTQGKNDTAIINLDNQETHKIYTKMQENYPGHLFNFSNKIEKNNLFINNNILSDQIFDLKSYIIPDNKYLSGKHNKENIAASYILARSLGIEAEIILKSLISFKALPHRCEYVKEIKNTFIINDSKATNADATYHALNSYENIYWIVGGLPKSEGINKLIEFFPKIKKAYLVGQAKYDFASLMNKNQLKNIICDDLEQATNFAMNDAIKNNNHNVILLSPSCSSVDEWKNFEARGEAFKKYVINWEKNSLMRKFNLNKQKI